MNKQICDVYKSAEKEGYYLFVEKKDKLRRVPDKLLELLGEPTFVMTFVLTPDKKLEQASAIDVIQEIEDKGFYLQISKDEDLQMQEIARLNDKLFGLS